MLFALPPASPLTPHPLPPAADEPSFGSREAKIEGCGLQRKAWDANVELLTPIFTSLRGPLPQETLYRGSHGLSWAERLEAVRLKNAFDSSKPEEDAKVAMVKAACWKRPVGVEEEMRTEFDKN